MGIPSDVNPKACGTSWNVIPGSGSCNYCAANPIQCSASCSLRGQLNPLMLYNFQPDYSNGGTVVLRITSLCSL